MSEPDQVRVVVVDDHAIVRDGLVALLSAMDGTQAVGQAADAAEALLLIAAERPDVVLMDIQMPGELDGIEATRRIAREHPDVRVVMLTMNEEDETVVSAIRAGASGYLLKGSGAAEVLAAVRAAHQGGVVFGARLAGRAGRPLPGTGRHPDRPAGPGRPDGARARGPAPARGRRQQRRHRARVVRVQQDRAQHRLRDLRQAARQRPRRGHRQGAGGGLRPAS